jgi:hypothetical protein
LGYLAASLGIGVLQLTSSTLRPILWVTYVHLLVIGWLTQLIFGVAFWMFPRHSRESPHGKVRLGWACYGLLNAGLLLRTLGDPARAAGWHSEPLLGAAALLQATAGWGFIILMWPRIRER